MKNRNHCGRSPTTITVDYLPVLELSGDLFARKFDDIVEPEVKVHVLVDGGDLVRDRGVEKLDTLFVHRRASLCGSEDSTPIGRRHVVTPG